MLESQKPIRLSGHARDQIRFRGATEAEVVEAIRRETWQSEALGRQSCRRQFRFDADWNGKQYASKQVRPIFVVEPAVIVVVTVYVYYF